MKVRYEADIANINRDYFVARVGELYHSEAGPADIYLFGMLVFHLGGETIWKVRCTPELWEKYGDPQIRNANKA